MKNTKICPKCNASDVVRIDGYSGPYGTGNNIIEQSPKGNVFAKEGSTVKLLLN